jgi:hypothetical protein
LCEDTFRTPKAATRLFQASFNLIPDNGMDAAVSVVFFVSIEFEFTLPCSWSATTALGP